MERRKFLTGMGAAAVGGGAVLGSGAFSRIESDRSVTIEVAEDPDAYLGLDACDSPLGEQYVDIDESGHLYVDIGETENGGQGVNSDSRTWFDDLVQLCNQGSDDACIWIERGDDWPEIEEGEYAGESRVDFYLGEDDESILGEENAVELGVGECECIGIRTDTHGVDATAEETLLDEIDDVVTLVADVECPDAGPQPGQAFFDVSDLDPAEISVDPGEPFTVSATITNAGDEAGEQDVDLLVDGDGVDSQSLSLEADDSETVAFEDVSTDDLDEGEYALTVATDDNQASGTLTVGEPDEWIQLFNGEDIDDWTPKFSGYEPGENYNDTFTVEDGVLRVDYSNYDSFDGVFGHLFYDDEFSHYMLRAEYRFVGEQAPNPPGAWAFMNNGLMLHGQTPEEMDIDQDFPRSLEFQLLGEEEGTEDGRPNGDLCTPGTYAHNMDGELVTAHCWTETEGSVYEGDDWVTATAVVRGNELVQHILEDDGVVLEYQEPVVAPGEPEADADEQVPIDSGTISIQSESHPIEFRTIELKHIDPDAPIEGGDPTSPDWSNYRKKELAAGFDEPMAIEVAPDGRVFVTERTTGNLKILDPDTGETTTALTLDVYVSGEDGLQGLVLDPGFEDNGWVYLYYSAPHETIDEDAHKRLSRFTVEGDTIDPDSEVEILRVPAVDNPNYHVGGDLEFGPEGNLWLSTGDDVSPFDSSGYTPIDESGDEVFDAQGTAADSSDLRGSILRITPNDDGSYDVPDGNLSDEYEGEPVREEIYVMGCRNPFRMAVDEDGVVYWGDYGPDARSWNAERGPPGIVEFNRAEEPGYYGWPYVVGPNLPYVDYDFATGESGEPFDPENLVNDSPHNDGLTDLPTPEEPDIWYSYSWDALLDSPPAYAEEYLPDEPPFPEFEGGAPMGGPVYDHREDYGRNALAEEFFDEKQLIGEWGQQWIRYVSYDEDGDVEEIQEFMPDEDFLSPMDMTIGPDGALYLLEWGDGYADPSLNGIYRIERVMASPSLDLGSESLAPGDSTTATVTVENVSDSELSDGEFSLASDSDAVEVTEPSETSFDSLAAGATQSVEYDLAAGADAEPGTYALTAEITFTIEGEEESVEANAEIEVSSGNPLEESLEAYFSFDGDTPTNEVTGTDATVEGDVTTGQPGILNNAYEFDVNQETGVEIPPSEATSDGGVMSEPLSLNGEGATAAAWINFTDHEQWARAPFQVGGSLEDGPAGGWDLEFSSNDDAIIPQVWDGGNPSRSGSAEAIPIDPETWYFVVMVVDGGNSRLHVFDQDGELDASPRSWTGSREQSDGEPLNIGVGQGYDMAGRVDEVYAHSAALSEGDVSQLYTESLQEGPLYDGLEARFTLDGDTPTNEVTGDDATVEGDVTTGQPGIVGDAYEFDVDQETGVEIPPSEATSSGGVMTGPLPINGEGATAAAWINYTDHEQWGRAPFQIGGSLEDVPADGWNVQFESNEDALRPELWDGGSASNGSGGTPIPVDPETWYFVVMVVDGGDARVHVFDEDGELDESPQTWTGGSRSQSESAPLNIGGGQGYDMAGRVDDVWAYSRALPESDVTALYEGSLEGDGDDSVSDDAIESGTAIELEGVRSGWVGLEPAEIEGETNPTLVLQEGESYELGWTQGDGDLHNIAIRDENGEVVDDLVTEITDDPGDGLQFTASEEMTEYVCQPHSSSMIGDIDVR